jgi:ribosomal protein S18 acetylase RimI-like enzyme
MICRKFQEKDWKELHRLYNRMLHADRVTEGFFLEHLILSPNFDPEGIILTEENGKLSGAAVAQIVTKNVSPWTDQVSSAKSTGYLMPPLIDNAETGKILIAEAEKFFLANGRTTVRVSSLGPTLFPDSTDEKAYPEICRALDESGYTVAARYHSMKRGLTGYTPSEQVAAKAAELKRQGIEAKVCEWEDVPAVKRFMMESSLIGRIQNLASKIRQNELDQIVIIRNVKEVLGYCQYKYYDELERVGPFGVTDKMRGQGIGQVMTAKLLTVMAQRGLPFAWFASCTETNAHFYRKNGFEIFRTKRIYMKDLRGEVK